MSPNPSPGPAIDYSRESGKESDPSPARKTTDELLSQRTEELRLLTHEAAELLAENKELRGEIGRLSDALRVALEKPGSGVAQDELHHCTREQNDVLDRQNQLLKEEVSKLQIAVSHLKEQQQDYSNRFNEADAKAQEFARLLARSEERRSIAETRLEELSAEAQTSEERRAQIERDAQGDRHQRKSLEDSIQNLREEVHQKTKALQDAEARARAAVDRLRAVEATNARRLSSLEGQVDDSKSRIAQLMGDLNIARTEAEGAHKIVKSLEKRRADTQFRLDDCKAELMETRDQLAELQTARDRATLQEQGLSEKLELEVRARKADVAEVKREAAEAVATEKETSRRKCADLETKLESADEVTASLRARICTLEEEVTSLRKANNVLSREIDRERDLRNKESDDLQSSRLALVSENDELDKRIRALRDELSFAQASLKTQWVCAYGTAKLLRYLREEMMVARRAEVAGEKERLAKRCAKAEEDVVVTRKEIEMGRSGPTDREQRLVEQLEKEVTHHRNAVERKEGEVQAAAHQNEAELVSRRKEAEKLRKQLEGLKQEWLEREETLKRKMQEKIEVMDTNLIMINPDWQPWPRTFFDLSISRAKHRDGALPVNRSGGRTKSWSVLLCGVAVDHPDLKGRLLNGFDASGGSRASLTDNNGHGTAIAGIIAANINNRFGTAGIADKVEVRPIRITDRSDNRADLAKIASAWEAALKTGSTDILVYAYASPFTQELSFFFKRLLKKTVKKGILVLTSAVNSDKFDSSSEVSLPCALANGLPGVLCVAAMHSNKTTVLANDASKLASFGLPGTEVLKLTPEREGDYWAFLMGRGSSFATATAAGVVALMKSFKNFSPEETEGMLLNSTEDAVTTKSGSKMTYGVLRPDLAIEQAIVQVRKSRRALNTVGAGAR
ncbi:hypothetical protein FOZ62_007919 [Perkinsus olseni]|uniref:subtilisin n=1 Tax=Perkinsus olseni TaxID=32597 RepID=A0A7J6SXF5_PEROL|nr:hypothetical protein FOZ62_007919 [Perkinsus olseni]